MMGGATVAIGLPADLRARIGVAAPMLLLACRLVQGFAVGGEWGGAVLMVAEHGDASAAASGRRWPQAGVPLGNLLATAVLWRPGGGAVRRGVHRAGAGASRSCCRRVLVLVGLWVRLSLEESPVFAEAQQAEIEARGTALPILEVVRRYPRRSSSRWARHGGEHLVLRASPRRHHLRHDLPGAPRSPVLNALLIGAAMQFLLIPLLGALSDRIGRRPLYLVGAVGVGVWGFVFFSLRRHPRHRLDPARGASSGCSSTPLMYGPQAAFFSELFGTSVRYTGASVGYQLASIFAGALAPIIALTLLGPVDTRNTFAVGVYLAIASVITVVSVLLAKETKASSLRHDRVLPGAHD